jgi:hypothetical protein
MTFAQYQGHFAATYPDYVDAATGRTLTVQPGQSYTVTVAPGRNASLSALPGDGRWGVSAGAAERPREDDPAGDPPAAAEDPPAAPEPPPAEPAGESEPEPIPAAGEPAASPESEA